MTFRRLELVIELSSHKNYIELGEGEWLYMEKNIHF